MKVLAKPWTMNVGNDPSTTAWTFVSNCRSPPIPCSLSPGVKSDALLFGTIRLTLSWRRVSIVSHLCELVLRRFSLSSSIPRTDAIAALCCSSLFSSFASPLSSSYRHLGVSGWFVHHRKTTCPCETFLFGIKLGKSRLWRRTISMIRPLTFFNSAKFCFDSTESHLDFSIITQSFPCSSPPFTQTLSRVSQQIAWVHETHSATSQGGRSESSRRSRH